MKRARQDPSFQFVVIANTGIQICQNFHLPKELAISSKKLWKAAEAVAKESYNKSRIVRMFNEHISANQEVTATGWVPCSGDPETDFAFFRLVDGGDELMLDIVIDTNNGAGAQLKNRIECTLSGGAVKLWKKQVLANIYVDEYASAPCQRGSLVIDFGNSASTALFIRTGDSTHKSTLIRANEPFDPEYRQLSEQDVALKKSNFCILRASNNPEVQPWCLMGNRAQAVIQEEPKCTYLYAPKKYIRHWPEHLAQLEPSSVYRGVVGQQDGLYPMLQFVQYCITHLLGNMVSSLCNPKLKSTSPEMYPLLDRIMLTYPLTWREQDKRVFINLVEQAVETLQLNASQENDVVVELICSEPTAVASYLIWELLYQYGPACLPLIHSTLGNIKNEPRLRLVLVDLGGGSSDIAMIDANFDLLENEYVDVQFQMVESMRFNRAGDRLTHILLTRILQYFRDKYAIDESLCFQEDELALNLNKRRSTISVMTTIAEGAKIALSKQGAVWTMPADEEVKILSDSNLGDLVDEIARQKIGADPLIITEQAFEQWVRRDRQSAKTGGEPGFMDVFLFLGELNQHLTASEQRPHMVVLSGRTSRLSFVKRMVMEQMNLPSNRVRELRELLPVSTEINDHQNVDKLAVVAGAHRFRFGDNVRFSMMPEVNAFNRFIGTVKDTPDGLVLNEIHIRPGMTSPRTITVEITPSVDLRIGHCFRENGLVEVIAVISNNSMTETHKVKVDIVDDYTVKMSAHPEVVLSEWVPGGNDIIVDNFYDTGNIDANPRGFILNEVLLP